MGALVLQQLAERNPNIPTNAIDDVILGCHNQAGEDNRNVARMALLLAGIRSSLLWHQLGGRRWHLIVYKKRIRDCVSQVRRKLMTIH